MVEWECEKMGDRKWKIMGGEFIKYNTCFITPFLVKSMSEWFFEKQIGLGMFYHSDNGLLLIRINDLDTVSLDTIQNRIIMEQICSKNEKYLNN